MMLTQEEIADSQGPRNQIYSAATPVSPRIEETSHTRLALWAALATVVTLATGHVARQWMMAAIANVCVLGGILAAPLISLIAWVGMVLPTKAPLHQMAPTLMTGALVWLALAIIGAHAFRLDRREQGK